MVSFKSTNPKLILCSKGLEVMMSTEPLSLIVVILKIIDFKISAVPLYHLPTFKSITVVQGLAQFPVRYLPHELLQPVYRGQYFRSVLVVLTYQGEFLSPPFPEPFALPLRHVVGFVTVSLVRLLT